MVKEKDGDSCERAVNGLHEEQGSLMEANCNTSAIEPRREELVDEVARVQERYSSGLFFDVDCHGNAIPIEIAGGQQRIEKEGRDQ